MKIMKKHRKTACSHDPLRSMNSRALALIRKNKIRLHIGMLRHYWPVLAALAAAVLLIGETMLSALAHLGAELGVAFANRKIIFGFAVLFCFVRSFFTKMPTFKLNAASVLYAYNTPFFTKLLRRQKRFAFLCGSGTALIIAALLHAPLLDGGFIADWFKLTLLFYNSRMTAWIFYHGQGKKRMIAGFCFAMTALFAYLDSVFSALGAVSAAVMLEFYERRRLRLNMPKYCAHLRYLDQIMAAQSRNDYAEMVRLAEENRPAEVHGLRFQQLRPQRQTAIAAKSLLDLLRMQKQTYALILGWMLAGIVLRGNWIWALFQISPDPIWRFSVSALCIMAVFHSFFQANVRCALQFIEKSHAGLMLPYAKSQVYFGYLPFPAAVGAALALAADILCGVLSPSTLGLIFALALSYALMLCAKIRAGKLGRILLSIANGIMALVCLSHYC